MGEAETGFLPSREPDAEFDSKTLGLSHPGAQYLLFHLYLIYMATVTLDYFQTTALNRFFFLNKCPIINRELCPRLFLLGHGTGVGQYLVINE